MRPNAVKKLLKAGQPAVGTWLSLGSITAARFMARAGFNWLTVDIEHSLVDWETATHMFGSIADAGCKRWVDIISAADNSDAIFGYEITYWTKGPRTIVCIIFNPEIQGSSTGGGNSAGLKTQALPITLAFTTPIKNVKNERTGEPLNDNAQFPLTGKQNEAIILSFDTRPAPR